MGTTRRSSEPRTGPPPDRPAESPDDHTFGNWLETHRPRMLSVAARYAHGSVGAEDLVQKASMAAYNALQTLKDPEAAGAWLVGFVRNVGLQEARKHARQSSLLEAHASPAASDTGHPEDAILLKVDIRRVVDELPGTQRTVVICRWFRDMSHKEIAATVGRPEGTVRSDLCRAHATLRRKLREVARDR